MGVLAALLAGAFLFGKSNGSKETERVVVAPTPSRRATPTAPCPADAFDRAVKGTVRLEARNVTGTGFLISDSVIVTNRHVVDSGGPITVQFADGGKGTGTVAGTSDILDVALVRLSTPALALPLTWGNSDTLKSLDTVVAVGYPLGLYRPSISGQGLRIARAHVQHGRPVDPDRRRRQRGQQRRPVAQRMRRRGGPDHAESDGRGRDRSGANVCQGAGRGRAPRRPVGGSAGVAHTGRRHAVRDAAACSDTTCEQRRHQQLPRAGQTCRR